METMILLTARGWHDHSSTPPSATNVHTTVLVV
jgi:hypothetical protein